MKGARARSCCGESRSVAWGAFAPGKVRPLGGRGTWRRTGRVRGGRLRGRAAPELGGEGRGKEAKRRRRRDRDLTRKMVLKIAEGKREHTPFLALRATSDESVCVIVDIYVDSMYIPPPNRNTTSWVNVERSHRAQDRGPSDAARRRFLRPQGTPALAEQRRRCLCAGR